MAVTLTANLTEIDDADSITNWASNETLESNTTYFREGSASVGVQRVSQETSYAQYDYYTDHSNTYLDITGETHIYFWIRTVATLDTLANGGVRIRLTDGSGNYREWWVGGSDNYYGNWQCYVIYTGTTVDDSSGTLNLAQVRYITYYFKVISKTVSSDANCFVDIAYYGTGIKVTGGTSGAKGTFAEIITADATPAYGILSYSNGVYIAQGPIEFGDDTSGDTYFKDTGQILLFADALVADDHYEIKISGNSGGTNSFELGNKSGTQGIQGCIIKSVGNTKVTLDATDTDINVFGLYGCTFLDFGIVALPDSGGTTREVLNCSFNDGARVKVNTCTVTNCNFINADDFAVEVDDTNFAVTYSNFISNSDAILHVVSGSYNYSHLTFTGNTYDVTLSGATAQDYVVINSVSSNPSSTRVIVGSGISILNSVFITIDAEDTQGAVVSGAAVAVYTASGAVTELMNEYTNTAGRAQESYNYLGDMPINIRIRKSSPGSTRYFPIDTTGTIESDGFSLTVVMNEDDIVS